MIWRLITENLLWKLGSLAIAVMLWYAVVGEPEVVTSQSFAILYKDMAPDLLIGSDAPNRVQLELRGPASRLTAASMADTSDSSPWMDLQLFLIASI